jgi:thiol:disulfide interchange protein DsbD
VGFTGKPIELISYHEPTTVFVPVMVMADAQPGKGMIVLSVRYQACDDAQCFVPQEVALTIPIEIVSANATITPAPDASKFTGFDASVLPKIDKEAEKQTEFDFLGYKFSVSSGAFVLIALIAFVAGVLMNFTPCVLPVIPIKILSIQSHAKSPGKLVYFGTIYCLGIVTLYAILGLMAFGLITGGKKFDWGQIFTIPWFVIAMSLIIAIMAVGMLGLFEIRLPNFVYAVNPTGETALGNFIGGVLTGILAVPCTGPLLGATLAWIFTQPPVIGLGTFIVMGLGMASPYALLMAFPGLVSKMPRGGPGSELLKKVLGVFLLSVAAFLAGNLTPERWPWFIIGAIFISGCVVLIVGAWKMLRSQHAKVINTIFGTIGIVGGLWTTYSLTKPPPVDWRVFRDKPDAEIQSAIAQSTTEGKVTVVDFTAKWCTNCHVIEKNVIYAEDSVKALKAPDVQEFKIDLTNAGDAQGWQTVRQISGGGGIPLIAIFGPGLDKPIYFQSFFKPSDLIEAINKARKK